MWIHAAHHRLRLGGDLRRSCAAAVVKKVVFDEVQFFPANSTMQGEVCETGKSFELMWPQGLWNSAAEG
jgi:hypothetical protein